MGYIEDISRSALTAAHNDLAKGRRGLLLGVGILALVHLLTVYPYLRVSRELEGQE